VLGTVQDNQFLQIQEDYLVAKAKLGYLQKDYARQRELNKTKASSDKMVQSAQADYNSNLALIRVLEEKLRFMGINPSSVARGNIISSVNIYAPVSGYIKKVNVSVGQYISPQEPLYEIVNPDKKHLVLTIFEKDISKISEGMEVSAYTNSDPNTKYRLKVMFIGRDFSEDRSTEVHCDFITDSGKILPGMYMNALVKTDSQNSQAVPDDAIVDFEGKKYVFVETQPMFFKMNEVQTTASEDGKVSLLEPEKLAGKKIAVKGAYNLLMAMKNKEE
jgi:cobalt-zinc-cadmium efflux system membrane fusion protein